MDQFERVANATVRIVNRTGQGILVPGGFILTAAHCIDWDADGQMSLTDDFMETIKTTDGRTYRVRPVAVDPVSDVALLAALDDQEFSDDAAAFDGLYESTEPATLVDADYPLFEPFAVRVRSHRGEWLEGTAQKCSQNAHSLIVMAEPQIEPGTSGGPIVDLDGRVIAVVSKSNGGPQPVPLLSLPVWAVREIERAVDEVETSRGS